MSTEFEEASFYQALSFEVAWHAFGDACPKCLQLDGQIWTFPRLTGILGHPSFGSVYDLDADVSLMHKNCRCYLEFTPYIDLEKTDVYISLKKVFAKMEMRMPSNIEEANRQVAGLRANIGGVRGELREAEYILYRTLGTMQRAGLPPALDKAIETIQKVTIAARVLHSTIMYLEMGTPLGWILAIISGFSFAMGASQAYDSIRGN
jgi:hypothetical protein